MLTTSMKSDMTCSTKSVSIDWSHPSSRATHLTSKLGPNLSQHITTRDPPFFLPIHRTFQITSHQSLEQRLAHIEETFRLPSAEEGEEDSSDESAGRSAGSGRGRG